MPITKAIRQYLQVCGLGHELAHWPVYEAWSAVLGSVLARRAVPVSFRNGELCVEVESSAHLQELKSFTGEGFRRQANLRLGEQAISKVVFRLKR